MLLAPDAGFDDGLQLIAANGSPIEGWVEVTFKLLTGSKQRGLVIPILVTHNSEMENPIIGYNVIQRYLEGLDGPTPTVDACHCHPPVLSPNSVNKMLTK